MNVTIEALALQLFYSYHWYSKVTLWISIKINNLSREHWKKFKLIMLKCFYSNDFIPLNSPRRPTKANTRAFSKMRMFSHEWTFFRHSKSLLHSASLLLWECTIQLLESFDFLWFQSTFNLWHNYKLLKPVVFVHAKLIIDFLSQQTNLFLLIIIQLQSFAYAIM